MYGDHKLQIHTTLEPETKRWLEKEAKDKKTTLNDIIKEVVEFYKINKTIPAKYETARLALKAIVREELKEQGVIK